MSETTEITPALTAEDWYRLMYIAADQSVFIDRDGATGEIILGPIGVEVPASVLPKHHHAIAALALYGQPFGFTREDVEALLSVADAIDMGFLPDSLLNREKQFRAIAARIAALLPPTSPPP
jgi:hypothetical protein